MVRLNNKARPVAVPRSVLRTALAREVLAALGATETEIEAAQTAALGDEGHAAPNADFLNPSTATKE